jgi:hypothetical protein
MKYDYAACQSCKYLRLRRTWWLFTAHLGNLKDTPVEQLDWQLPARVHVTLDGNVAAVHNMAGTLLMGTCRACYMRGVVTGRVQPDVCTTPHIVHTAQHSNCPLLQA